MLVIISKITLLQNNTPVAAVFAPLYTCTSHACIILISECVFLR
jgi:hypothetical protein